MDDIYKNIEECNPNKKGKILIVFGGTIASILNNKKLNPMLTELFLRGRKLNIYPVLILFCCSEKYYTKFNTLCLYENSNKRELQQIAF